MLRNLIAYILVSVNKINPPFYFFFIDLFTNIGSSYTNGIILYIILIKTIQSWEEMYFEKQIEKLNHPLDVQVMKQVLLECLLEREKMTRTKQRVVSLLGIIPFLWFLHLLFMAAGLAIAYQSWKHSSHVLFVVNVIVNLYAIIPKFILIMILVLVAEKFHSKISLLSKSVCHLILKESKSPDLIPILDGFHSRVTAFKFSVWHLFNMNHNLILYFISCLFVYTALLVQVVSLFPVNK